MKKRPKYWESVLAIEKTRNPFSTSQNNSAISSLPVNKTILRISFIIFISFDVAYDIRTNKLIFIHVYHRAPQAIRFIRAQ